MSDISWHLLDTNTVSYIIRGTIPSVREKLQKIPISRIGISTVTQAELLFGLAKKPDAKQLRTAVESFLAHVEVIPWGEEAAKEYAQIRADLERRGRSLGSLDTLIAAHARSLSAILVTNDGAFKNVRKLHLADWTKP